MFSHLKKRPCNKLYPKKPPKYCSNDAVPWLNKAKGRRFRCTVNFKNFKIHLDFIYLPVCCKTRLRAPEVSDFQGNDGRLTNLLLWLHSIHCIMLFALNYGFVFFLKDQVMMADWRISCSDYILSTASCCLLWTMASSSSWRIINHWSA